MTEVRAHPRKGTRGVRAHKRRPVFIQTGDFSAFNSYVGEPGVYIQYDDGTDRRERYSSYHAAGNRMEELGEKYGLPRTATPWARGRRRG